MKLIPFELPIACDESNDALTNGCTVCTAKLDGRTYASHMLTVSLKLFINDWVIVRIINQPLGIKGCIHSQWQWHMHHNHACTVYMF